MAQAAMRLEKHLQQKLDGVGSQIGRVFPNRRLFRWQVAPHPLLQQQTIDLHHHGLQHKAVFHESLMGLYSHPGTDNIPWSRVCGDVTDSICGEAPT